MKKIQRLPLWMIKISSISVVLPCLAQNNNTYSWQLFKTLKGHTGAVRSVVFSPDGKELISGSRDETIRFWDVRTVLLKDTYSAYNKLRGHIGSVHVVAFGKSPYLFASGSRDGTVVLWGSKKTDSCFKKVCNAGILAECTFAPYAEANRNWNEESMFVESKTCDHCEKVKITA